MHITSKALLTSAFGSASYRASSLPPSFLLPAFISQTSAFSTTSCASARKDGNPSRGVSALKRTGLNKKQKLTVTQPYYVARGEDGNIIRDEKTGRYTRLTDRQVHTVVIPSILPKPVRDPAKRSSVQVDEDHGLWEFFNESRESIPTPLQLSEHGRGWVTSELREKDWEDLWRLWWVCSKEMNRLKTFRAEKKRVGSMYGEYEADGREDAIKQTQRNIKQVLTERWYAWENARSAAMEDEEVNLYADPARGQEAYIPKAQTRIAEDAPVELQQDRVQVGGEGAPASTYVPYESGKPQSEARL